VKPRTRRTLAEWAQTAYRLSQRRAARLIPVRLETLRYRSTRDRQDALRQRLRELAAVRVRFGYRRLTVLLKRAGWPVNAKRIYRLYDDEGLTCGRSRASGWPVARVCRWPPPHGRTSDGAWTSSAHAWPTDDGFGH